MLKFLHLFVCKFINIIYLYIIQTEQTGRINSQNMKTVESIRQAIRSLGSDLINRGVPQSEINYSDSSTSFGNSSYLMVGTHKVRVSDHSVTAPRRIMNEWHLCEYTYNRIANEIERYFFPERFEKIVEMVYGDEIEFPFDKIQNEPNTTVVINECKYITKRGRTMCTIVRQNIEQITYKRK